MTATPRPGPASTRSAGTRPAGTRTAQARPARARDADATRADLLQAARRRFSALGYQRTTSRDIAKDAGANVSLIYRYFGSKEQLFEVVMEESADLFGRLRGTPLSEMVDQFVDGLDPKAYPEFGYRHPLLVLSRETDDDTRTARLQHQTFGAVLSYLAEEIAKARCEGEPTPAEVADARVRAGLLFSMFTGIVTLRAAIPEDPFTRADIEQLRSELAGIVAEVVARP